MCWCSQRLVLQAANKLKDNVFNSKTINYWPFFSQYIMDWLWEVKFGLWQTYGCHIWSLNVNLCQLDLLKGFKNYHEVHKCCLTVVVSVSLCLVAPAHTSARLLVGICSNVWDLIFYASQLEPRWIMQDTRGQSVARFYFRPLQIGLLALCQLRLSRVLWANDKKEMIEYVVEL